MCGNGNGSSWCEYRYSIGSCTAENQSTLKKKNNEQTETAKVKNTHTHTAHGLFAANRRLLIETSYFYWASERRRPRVLSGSTVVVDAHFSSINKKKIDNWTFDILTVGTLHTHIHFNTFVRLAWKKKREKRRKSGERLFRLLWSKTKFKGISTRFKAIECQITIHPSLDKKKRINFFFYNH